MATRKSKLSEQLCWTCEGKVKAERRLKPWSLGDALAVLLTAGLWVPLRFMYHAVASPWRCLQCGCRIEEWQKSLGRAAAYGSGGLVLFWLAVPGFISVIRSSDKAAERGKEAIDRERARRVQATAEFRADRTLVTAAIEGLLEEGHYEEAYREAGRFLFLDDDGISELHGYADRKATERRLLTSIERTPESDIDRREQLYARLADLEPSNSIYDAKHVHYRDEIQERQKKNAALAKAKRAKPKQDRMAATLPSAAPLSVKIERYQNTADSGANFKVINSTNVEYDQCSIELGDRHQEDRWFLPNPTVLDAQGMRSYPTFLFRDRRGVTPPTAVAIRHAEIRCSTPSLRQAFRING